MSVFSRTYEEKLPRPIVSVRDMLEQAVAKDADHVAYCWRDRAAKTDVSVTNRAFYEDVEKLGAGLVSLGLSASHIACVGENSYPWIESFLTVLMSAGVFVPIDRELPEENILFLLRESDSEAVFCSEKYAKIFREHRDEIPNVRYFFVFGLCPEREDDTFLSFEGLKERGSAEDRSVYDALRSDPNELKYLVFTSGTTGVAKGVMLTEHNVLSGIYYGMQVSHILDKGLSVLPYNHCYEAVCDILVAIHSHTTLCINDSLKRVAENIRYFKPDYIYLVPAFSEHFYNSVKKEIARKGAEKKIARAIRFSNALRKVGIDLRRVLFAELLAGFGGNLRKIVCGGAPIRPEIGEFFDSIGISLTGGYGITECAPLVSVNDDRSNNYSSAGHRLGCLEWRIDSPKEDGIGEICVRGDVVMKGYYKRSDLTADAIRDGWFYTGDFGYLTENDEIVLTGRKKNIIVLNNGKNIYPEELESMIGNLPYVTEVVVSGVKNDHGQDVALSAEVYCEEADKADTDKLKADIRSALAKLPTYKQIRDVILRATPFDKTTTNKIRRDSATVVTVQA